MFFKIILSGSETISNSQIDKKLLLGNKVNELNARTFLQTCQKEVLIKNN